MIDLLTAQHSTPPQVLPIDITGQRCLGIMLSGQSHIGVLMVSGGAQTRAGSHRLQQQLAQRLQQHDISSLRFDFPGYGDAEGEPQDFIQHARCLPEVLSIAQQKMPQIRDWVLFGLCDGASAILLNQHLLQQTSGVILLNPWCRAAQNHAQTMVRFYYWQRLRSKEFWQKLLTGKGHPLQSLTQFVRFWRRANEAKQACETTPAISTDNFLPQMVLNWSTCTKPVLLVLSEQDLTAQECSSLLATLPEEQRQSIMAQSTILSLSGANHTCSEAEHLQQLQQSIINWLHLRFQQ
ncbi:MAG: hydrolase 1, exosortase A system-associated [Rheinheimera sp.]